MGRRRIYSDSSLIRFFLGEGENISRKSDYTSWYEYNRIGKFILDTINLFNIETTRAAPRERWRNFYYKIELNVNTRPILVLIIATLFRDAFLINEKVNVPVNYTFERYRKKIASINAPISVGKQLIQLERHDNFLSQKFL